MSPQSVVMGAVYSVENEDPQPHVDFAFGFLIVNPPPVMVSTKSTSAFFRYWMLIGSTKSLTPFDSNTRSPAPCPFSSIIIPYWNPEQPPPCTNTRKPLPAFCSSANSSLTFAAAVSEMLIMTVVYQSDRRPPKGKRLKADGISRFAP